MLQNGAQKMLCMWHPSFRHVSSNSVISPNWLVTFEENLKVLFNWFSFFVVMLYCYCTVTLVYGLIAGLAPSQLFRSLQFVCITDLTSFKWKSTSLTKTVDWLMTSLIKSINRHVNIKYKWTSRHVQSRYSRL